MDVVGRKTIFFSISGALVLVSFAASILYGFKPGIDFVGGTLWQIRIAGPNVSKGRVETFFAEELKAPGAVIIEQEDSFLIRSGEISETDHQAYSARLKELGEVTELRFETIGAAVGYELRVKAIIAFVLVLFAISLYIAFVFRKVSYPVSSWKYGVITLLTLFHDAVIPVGLFALLGKFANAEVDVNFVVAVLVVMGFSVHDTIVVFDRIRENLRTNRAGKFNFSDLVNQSVNQTMARSVNTSLTLVLVLIALYLFASSSLHYFVLTILVGTVVGTYSSIFVASPLLTLWQKHSRGAA